MVAGVSMSVIFRNLYFKVYILKLIKHKTLLVKLQSKTSLNAVIV